uniref:Post-glycosylphosphatidylinositol attachment to proteins 6 n=1 Tax=Cyprinus carpio TaxID=7962 RepID=A0A8C1W7B8_CYPCA
NGLTEENLNCKMEKYFALCLLLYVFAGSFAEDLTYSNGFYSKAPQRLSKYSGFGNVRLQHFRVPEDAVLVRWLLTVSRGSGLNCGDQNITVHFRAGAPPVINPLGTAFPNSTSVSLAHNLTLIIPSGQSSNVTLFNVTHPKPGDWFLAAHLPKDEGKIEQQGLPSCSYLFQAQLFLRRAADLPILQHNIPLYQTLTTAPALFKVFVPEFSSRLDVFILNCSVKLGNDCGLSVTVGSSTLREGSEVKQNCSGLESCSASVLIPPWNSWLLVMVETSQPNTTIPFSISANVTVGCKPLSVSSDFNTSAFIRTIIAPQSNSSGSLNDTSVSMRDQTGLHANSSEPMCMKSPSVFRDEQDVLSLRFIVSSNLTVTSDLPTVLTLEQSPGDSGGTFVVQLNLNTSSLVGGFAHVKACLTATSQKNNLCNTWLMQGYSLSVSSKESQALLRIPFPDATVWYLSLQTVCNDSVDCRNASAIVSVSLSVSACIDDCGPYGECRLQRTHSYLYGACVCKAGWQGWGCTDGATAQSYSRQLAAALLLTFSNFFFIPPIVVALYRGYHTEAMCFLQFYHACDQPGVTVMCIMDYDTLQFCDFLGSVVSVWVTIVCMARLQDPVKYLLFMAGTLIISMAMQLDRRGLWNLLGPVLFALVIMVTSWVYRGVKRHQCYPPLWRRWVLFLLPGIVSALIGVCVYVFAQTDSNYYYTHSIWHVMVATSVVFLLPPREKHVPPWGWTNKICSYRRCKNEKVEHYTVN